MDAVGLFAVVLAQRGRVQSVGYSSLPAYGDLIKAGLIEEAGVVSSMMCDECDCPHEAKIAYEGSQYGYYCPEIGFVSKPRSELIALQPNLGTFVSQIADAVDCKRRKSSSLDKDTWRIGAIDGTVGDVVLYLHPTLQDAWDVRNFQAALASEVKTPFGVILTSKGTLTVPPFVTALLDEVLSFDPKAGQFALDTDLRAIAGIPEQRSGGRPNDFESALSGLMALRVNQGRAAPGRNEEAKALHAEFIARYPNKKCPSLPTVKRYVTRIRSGS